MKAATPVPLQKSGMTRLEVAVVIGALGVVVLGLIYAAMLWKRGADRSATLMHIRDCQQVMRSHAFRYKLSTGDPFGRAELEQHIGFPQDIQTLEGKIRFAPGTKVTVVTHPAIALTGEHLWLKVDAPATRGYVGRYGFDRIADTTGW